MTSDKGNAGLNAFSFDVDFFRQPEVVGIAGEFGPKGEIAVVKLLCAVYRNGYFIEWCDRTIRSLARELPNLSDELLRQIVNRLLRRGFFDRHVFDKTGVLTSREIQKQYLYQTKRRKNIGPLPYMLRDDGSFTMPGEPGCDILVESKTVVPSTGIKLKTAPAPVAIVADSRKERDSHQTHLWQNNEALPPEDSIGVLAEDTIWCETVCMREHMTMEALADSLREFAVDCRCKGKDGHGNIKEVKMHFCNWLDSQKRKRSAGAYSSSGGDYLSRRRQGGDKLLDFALREINTLKAQDDERD